MKIALFSTQDYDKAYFEKHNIANHEIKYLTPHLNIDTIDLVIGFEAVCVFVNDKLTEEVITAISKLGVKIILLRCAGFNNVDLNAAKKCDIKVYNVPEYSPHAVAEHAVALILCLNRKIHKAYNRVRDGNFLLNGLLGFDLYGKTIGIIGFGHIGSVFAKIMQGFGCKILVNSLESERIVIEKHYTYVDYNTLLKESNIISLHCPLDKDTYHLINANSISKMKNGVMLINTSRGALVDAIALKNGLQSGKIGSVAIDVYEQETNLFFSDLSNTLIDDSLILELMSYPNVLITAHQGFFTNEALTKIATETLLNIDSFVKNSTRNELTYKC